ncbi:MAG: M15 family metallopeptidase [Weeksellaceae bacterium]|nr:M15 family metallopeptidase [Weeksellaceae bacterium]
MRNIFLILLVLGISCSEKKQVESNTSKVDHSEVEEGLGAEIFDNKSLGEVSNASIGQGKGLMQKGGVANGSNKPDKYLIGDLDFSTDEYFGKVPDEFATKTIYIRKEALAKFLEMAKEAKKDGVSLVIVSGARSFSHQRSIWERKWNASTIEDPVDRAKELLKFSSMPMTSRHRWGTDIDINNLENEYFESGKGLKEYQWLVENASKFGFCQVYSDKKVANRKGYEMEKWHWSYMPLSENLLNRYLKEMNIHDISGFTGSEVAQEINVIETYVKGIHKCKF